ncbi:MAG: hypothetical protein ACKOWL_03150 [Sphingobacteriaceae bacterium]
MFNKPIRNLAELKAEKQKLRWEVAVREADFEDQLSHLQSIVETPVRWVHFIKDLFSHDESGKSDLISSLAQLGLPILLNSVIFKKSSLVIKGLVAIVSQQLARGVTAKNVASWIETLMTWVKNAENTLAKKVEEARNKKNKE